MTLHTDRRNFIKSATHNGWLKQYRRMVSTAPYYRVCEDLIADTAEIFGHPRFMHIGFDQIPCGTNWAGWHRRKANVGADDVIGKIVELGHKVVDDKRLLGFMMAAWASCDTEKNVAKNIHGIDLLADAFSQR